MSSDRRRASAARDLKRDAHMRSPDFLDTKKYPNATFETVRHVVEGS
ncbi:MAG: YceI family protein [Chloroflexi bacterium]|nr:YceI family protein [Chloroflexota bacterium]